MFSIDLQQTEHVVDDEGESWHKTTAVLKISAFYKHETHCPTLLSDFFLSAGFSSHMHLGMGSHRGVPSESDPESLALAAALAWWLGLLVLLARDCLAAW